MIARRVVSGGFEFGKPNRRFGKRSIVWKMVDGPGWAPLAGSQQVEQLPMAIAWLGDHSPGSFGFENSHSSRLYSQFSSLELRLNVFGGYTPIFRHIHLDFSSEEQ